MRRLLHELQGLHVDTRVPKGFLGLQLSDFCAAGAPINGKTHSGPHGASLPLPRRGPLPLTINNTSNMRRASALASRSGSKSSRGSITQPSRSPTRQSRRPKLSSVTYGGLTPYRRCSPVPAWVSSVLRNRNASLSPLHPRQTERPIGLLIQSERSICQTP